MQYRTLGRTGLNVSEIGFGAWGIGKTWWGPADDRESLKALIRAIDLGINFFDTAYVYGDGHSERLIGKAIMDSGQRVIVATKVPPKNKRWPALANTPIREAFPPDWIIRCTERSLTNLNRDHVDLQQLHVWDDAWTDETEWQEAIHRLKKEGKIRFFGISINDYQPQNALKLVRSGLVDSVQVIYNLFEQAPADELFPACQKEKVGIIVRVPFDEGSLTGTFTPEMTFHEEDFRRDYFRGDRLKEVCERIPGFNFLIRGDIKNLAQAALKFCLTHPAVSAVIPGMRKMRHVEENAKVSNGKLLTEEEIKRLRPLAWRRDFYQ
jgi:aryl-alcohol dehydrogenase-like predicted oxidoreductase